MPGSTINLQEILSSVKSFAQEGTDFIYFAAMLTGFVLGLMAIIDLARRGNSPGQMQQQPKSMGSILARLVIASCLITLARQLEAVIATNGSVDGIRSALAYAQGSSGSQSGNTLSLIWGAISVWMVFMGMVGFMRAFILFDKASQGGHDSGDAFWRGFWHLVGGALCINIFTA